MIHPFCNWQKKTETCRKKKNILSQSPYRCVQHIWDERWRSGRNTLPPPPPQPSKIRHSSRPIHVWTPLLSTCFLSFHTCNPNSNTTTYTELFYIFVLAANSNNDFPFNSHCMRYQSTLTFCSFRRPDQRDCKPLRSNNSSSTRTITIIQRFCYHSLKLLVVVLRSSPPGLLLQLVGPAEHLLGQRKVREHMKVGVGT